VTSLHGAWRHIRGGVVQSCISGTGRDINEIPTAPYIFDHAHFSGVTSIMPDVSRLLKINMAAVKPEVDCFSGTGRDINEIPTATPTFSTMPTSRELLPQCPMSADYLKSIWRPSNRKLIVSLELYQQSQSVI
jgi:hypothetical protein